MNAIRTPTHPSRPLCQFYVRNGTCRNGDGCRWSHDLRGMTKQEALLTIPCPFYRKGTCRFGDSCELKHAELNSPLASAADWPSMESKVESNQSEEECCGICLENTSALRRQFGILSCCNHVFCHKCIMEWRTEGSDEVSSRRVCPTCRKESDFVVPSNVHPATEEEKGAILRHYKERLSVIPCRNFDGDLGSCPFGSDCFYAHFDDDAKDIKSQDQTMQQLYQERQRHRNDRRGRNELEMISEMLLMMGMQRHLAAERNNQSRRGQREGRNRRGGRNDDDDESQEEDDDAIDFVHHFFAHFMSLHHDELEDDSEDEDNDDDSSMPGLE
ncbi:hypothetical protein HJC23_003432 [Cyclotella cryptica]|uniref:RING-type E3 ubiquitin transferase n=1 Tax=Cyclotella cryptica TaxID=29204 RepID=A0ABD3QRR8_9STRA|eukprot:CCRYP_002580-RA/>CCRYP_002580-RA protein AED:0.00 eAED:0.00 QI:45/-1/1/1/-1/1/1/124/328